MAVSMDDVIQALLSGATDERILELLAELEKSDDNEVNFAEKDVDYKSCIKVNGEPILPPVMTEEKRLESLMWKRKALDVEERIANKRRERLSENISNIFSQVLDSKNNDRTNTSQDNSEESEKADDNQLNVYDLLRCNSRAADELINNLEIDADKDDVTNNEGTHTPIKEDPSSITEGSPSSSRSEAMSYDAKTAPKSFEEVKSIAKALPRTPRSGRSQPRYLRRRQDSSDISDDETDATSIRTEIVDDGDDDDVEMFSFRSVISRTKEPYNHGLYQERSNIYDSMVSVNTVIENTDYNKDVIKRQKDEVDSDSEPEMRPRRGSYSLSKPSPVLLAYMERIASKDDVQTAAYIDKENLSPNISSKKTPPKQKVKNLSTPSGKKEILEKYLESISKAPNVNKTVNKKIDLEPEPESESLTLDLRSVVVATPTTTEPASIAPISSASLTPARTSSSTVRPSLNSQGSETFRTEDTQSRTLTLPEITSQPASIEPETVSKKIATPSLTSPESLQQAVSQLALQQQESLNELIRQQELARIKLREDFQKQQQMLMQEIFTQFPNLQVQNTPNNKLDDVEAAMERSISAMSQDLSRQDSLISHHDNSLDVSVSSTISQSQALHPSQSNIQSYRVETPSAFLNQSQSSNSSLLLSPSKVPQRDTNTFDEVPISRTIKRTGTFTKHDYKLKPVTIPEEAFSDKNQRAWTKLTAIGKGFLTRQLLKTEKVQMLKMTIKETVSCAVQLHLESEGPPSKEDLQLHSRLLAQIESACHDIHDTFFRLGVSEKMSILESNRLALREKMFRSQNRDFPPTEFKKKRLSSATEARLKAKNSPKVESWSDKRTKAVKEARQLSLKTGHVLYGNNNHVIRSNRKSPRGKSNVRKSRVISSAKVKQSSLMMSTLSPYAKKENKPVWK